MQLCLVRIRSCVQNVPQGEQMPSARVRAPGVVTPCQGEANNGIWEQWGRIYRRINKIVKILFNISLRKCINTSKPRNLARKIIVFFTKLCYFIYITQHLSVMKNGHIFVFIYRNAKFCVIKCSYSDSFRQCVLHNKQQMPL